MVVVAIIGLLATIIGFLVLFIREVSGVVGILGYFLTPLSSKDRALIELHSPYYRQLNAARKVEFATRVKHFIYEKEWIGKDLEVTREMQLRISATATQVTMGFDRLLLLHFSNILLYPDAYVERMTGQRMLGGTMPGRRTIALSWKHFLQGAENPTDGRHVGLHEMAHALWLENRIPNEEDDFLDANAMATWRELAEAEAVRIRRGGRHFLRGYAATDQAEFFAVALECFFEQPHEYRDRLPELYACMVRLLKQDPAEAAPPPQAAEPPIIDPRTV